MTGRAATGRAALTRLYLDEVTRNGIGARELLGRLPESELLNAYYHGRYLPRPLFLGYAERSALHADLENVRSALISLPDRMFGGDLAAFARAVGMTDDQVSAILRSRGPQISRHAKADLQVDEAGFRLLEYNMGSLIGGMDNADICRAMLEHPALAEFARIHHLGYVDTRREQINNVLVESGLQPGSFPVVAMTVWPDAWETDLAGFLRLMAVPWRELGLDAHPCHIGQLEMRDGRVWLHGRPVDIVYRLFLLEHLLEPGAAERMNPVLDAAARGEVQIFTPLDSELFGSKAALAMLSDQANRDLFSPAELASFDRILPWTRIVRPGKVTLEDGQRTDLLDYAIEHRRDLVLKPAGSCGGEGVVLGWDPGTSPALWREQLASAVRDTYVLQRRIKPLPELNPDDHGGLIPWTVTWAVFIVVNGYGGVFARALTAGSGTDVINRSSGASFGCCLSEEHEGPGFS